MMAELHQSKQIPDRGVDRPGPTHQSSSQSSCLTSSTFDAQGISKLLRDADAKCYSTARSHGRDPSVSIRLKKDGVYITCNHDGSPGATMPSPNEEHHWCLFHPLSGEKPGQGDHKLRLHLQAVSGNVLLPLKTLRSISITILDEIGTRVWSREARLENDIIGSLSTLSTVESTITRPPGLTATSRFQIMSFDQSKESESGKRISSHNSADVIEATSSSRVTLAFPVAYNGEPVTEKQDLHSVMPIRKGPFNFLVFADYLLSYEGDILLHHPTNNALRQAILSALTTAIRSLVRNPKIQHKWMRYLPSQEALRSDPFWSTETSSIAAALQDLSLVYSQDGSLCSISQLRRLREDQLDADGHPLFPDLAEEPIYPSEKYARSDLDILTDYGLKVAQRGELVSRLRALAESAAWPNKFYRYRNEDWHSRVARWILRAWEGGNMNWKDDLKKMALLPLSSEKLQSPEALGLGVPPGLPLAMIHPAAAANPDCRKLYEALGIVHVEQTTSSAKPPLEDSCGESKQTPQSAPVVEDSSFENDIFDDSGEVTSVWLSITEHQPEKLLSRLHADFCQPDLREKWQASDGRTDTIRKLEVTCSNGDSKLIFLTFLPTPSLLGRCAMWLAGEPAATMPFLKLEKPLPELGNNNNDDIMAWNDLADNFDIRAADDLEFSLEILDAVMAEDVRPKETLTKTVVGIYLRLLEICNTPAEAKEGDDPLEIVRSWFSENPGVLCTPAAGGQDAVTPAAPEWTFPEACRWSAAPGSLTGADWVLKDTWSPVFETLRPRDRINLESFFREVLRIWNVSYSEIERNLDSLRSLMKDEARNSSTETEKQAYEVYQEKRAYQLYQQLNKLATEADGSALVAIEIAFEEEPLIYLPSDAHSKRRWVSTSECVWESAAALVPDIPCLRPLYGDISLLFEDVLYAPYKGISHAVKQLAAIRKRSMALSINQAKELLRTLNDLISSSQEETASTTTKGGTLDPVSLELRAELSDCRIFPVRKRNGSQRLLTGSQLVSNENFAIPDDHIFGELFRQRANMLDFDVETVRQLDPLLQVAGLAGKYLSLSVFLTSMASVWGIFELDQEISSTICRKAAVWTSVAAHFKSPLVVGGTSKLHRTLTDLRVYSVHNSMPKSSRPGAVRSDSPLRIEDAVSGKLRIYIPGASKYFDDREYCLASRLPLEFSAYLMQCEPDAANPAIVCIIGSILQVQPKTALRILQDKAIPFLGPAFEEAALRADQPGFNAKIQPAKKKKPVVRLPPTSSMPKSPDGENPPPAKALPVTPSPERSTAAQSLTTAPLSRALQDASPLTTQRSPPPPIASTNALRQTRISLQSNPAYVTLLSHVVSKARVAQLPYESTAFDMAALLDVIGSEPEIRSAFSFSNDDQSDWQRMVGAAGELFVFELLSGLKPALPNFSRDNWESVVGHFAGAHPEYEGLPKKGWPERADIFYPDSSGILTTAFIQRGYLDETWRGTTPDYYMEVKTTMKNLEKSFFMSSDQYERMQEMGQSEAYRQKKELYVIFRVYGLNSGQVGVKVYPDPRGAKEADRLDFEQLSTGSWEITPRTSRTRSTLQKSGHFEWTTSTSAGVFNFGSTQGVFGASPGST